MTISKYLKWLLLSLILLTQTLILVSCTLPDIVQQMDKDATYSFHYRYGDSWGTHGEFWIWAENGIAYFEGSAMMRDKSVNAFAEVDREVFNSISQIILDNRIDLWDGFSKSNPDVLDGHGFSLDIEYETASIHANGYMFEPKNYQSGHNALLDFLISYAEGLPVTPPSADSVGYIIVSTENFRFDILLDMYDGTYSRVGYVNVNKKTTGMLDELDIYRFNRLSELQMNKQEGYVEFNFDAVQELRKRSLELVSSNGFPQNNDLEYVAINYEGHKITGNHFSYAVLSDEELDWFNEKILSVIGLSADFDFNTLFNDTLSK